MPDFTRRSLLVGMSAAIAAPAIVRASSLMPVRAWKPYYWGGIIAHDDMVDAIASALREPELVAWDVGDGTDMLALTFFGANGSVHHVGVVGPAEASEVVYRIGREKALELGFPVLSTAQYLEARERQYDRSFRRMFADGA